MGLEMFLPVPWLPKHAGFAAALAQFVRGLLLICNAESCPGNPACALMYYCNYQQESGH